MKKFKFSLDTVLTYKTQVLDALQGELAAATIKVNRQEEVLEELWTRYHNYNEDYRAEKQAGMTVVRAMFYQNGLRVLEAEIAQETLKLDELRKEEAKQREKVVEAKKDTSAIEKLREKKVDLYQKAVQKDEELLIDEFVSAARASAGAGQSAGA